MPFTLPATYFSETNSGYGSEFGFGSPLVFILEVKTISFPRYTVPKLNRTHLLSPNTTEEYTPGLIDPGAIALTANFRGDATQTSDLDTLVENQTVFNWTYTTPVQNRTMTATVSGNGFLAKYDLGPIDPNKPTEFSCDIQTTGFAAIIVS
jgi:hypothetical protein